MENIEEYYSEDYKILIDSEEEDQIVSFPDGSRAFRFELQVKTIFDKINIPKNARILDYGCAKSTTLKKMCEYRKDITPYLFDVSENYIPFWSKFVESDHWSIFEPKSEWQSHFDVITSFFSLEHVSKPVDMMSNIHALLKDDGYFYCIVPNTFTNTADFVVADHVNHFSAPSLHALLTSAGFEVIEIDERVHYGAFVIVAKKSNAAVVDGRFPLTDKLSDEVMAISQYWMGLSQKIKHFEQLNDQEDAVVAIYGSGFYGTFIASCLSDFENVKVFIDQNPFRQGMQLLGKVIVSPEQAPDDLQLIYVGLNPSIARKSIESVDCLAGRNIKFCYL